MSASDHLSKELFNSDVIHRGISGPLKKNASLGIHWSESPNTAESFGGPMRDIDDKGNYVLKKGTVLHGTVNKKAIIDPSSREGARFRKKYSIYHPESREEQDDSESEVTIRPGATVVVRGLTRIRPSNVGQKTKTRKIKFNPPRKMKA